ncbi:hypothetical protein D3C72_2517180 [compost metagenome]
MVGHIDARHGSEKLFAHQLRTNRVFGGQHANQSDMDIVAINREALGVAVAAVGDDA